MQADELGVTVEEGMFVVRLGQGTTTADLSLVLSENTNLWAEITVHGDASDDVLQPRMPVTAAPYSMNVPVIHGTGNPNAENVSAAIGTYYVDNGDANRTYLKVFNSWIVMD